MIRRKLMRVLFSIVASALLLMALASNAKADGTIGSVPVAGFSIKGLGNHVGQYLTVYYVMGRRASISTQQDQVKIGNVKLRKDFQITGDQIALPAVQIPMDGIFFPNLVVFVIHKTPDFHWVNLSDDGSTTSIPNGEVTTGSTAYESVDSLRMSEIQQLNSSNQIYQFGQEK